MSTGFAAGLPDNLFLISDLNLSCGCRSTSLDLMSCMRLRSFLLLQNGTREHTGSQSQIAHASTNALTRTYCVSDMSPRKRMHKHSRRFCDSGRRSGVSGHLLLICLWLSGNWTGGRHLSPCLVLKEADDMSNTSTHTSQILSAASVPQLSYCIYPLHNISSFLLYPFFTFDNHSSHLRCCQLLFLFPFSSYDLTKHLLFKFLWGWLHGRFSHPCLSFV